jgi:hypothetical protein
MFKIAFRTSSILQTLNLPYTFTNYHYRFKDLLDDFERWTLDDCSTMFKILNEKINNIVTV